MVRRGKVGWASAVDCRGIEADIRAAGLGASRQAAALKDLRLVEAALGSSGAEVVSIDQTSIDIYSELTESIPELGRVAWINPVTGALPPHGSV